MPSDGIKNRAMVAEACVDANERTALGPVRHVLLVNLDRRMPPLHNLSHRLKSELTDGSYRTRLPSVSIKKVASENGQNRAFS